MNKHQASTKKVSNAAIAGQLALYSTPEDPEKPKSVKVSIELVDNSMNGVTFEQYQYAGRIEMRIRNIRALLGPERNIHKEMEDQRQQDWKHHQGLMAAPTDIRRAVLSRQALRFSRDARA